MEAGRRRSARSWRRSGPGRAARYAGERPSRLPGGNTWNATVEPICWKRRAHGPTSSKTLKRSGSWSLFANATCSGGRMSTSPPINARCCARSSAPAAQLSTTERPSRVAPGWIKVAGRQRTLIQPGHGVWSRRLVTAGVYSRSSPRCLAGRLLPMSLRAHSAVLRAGSAWAALVVAQECSPEPSLRQRFGAGHERLPRCAGASLAMTVRQPACGVPAGLDFTRNGRTQWSSRRGGQDPWLPA